MNQQEIIDLLKLANQDTIFSFIAEHAIQDGQFYEKIKKIIMADDDKDEVGDDKDEVGDEEDGDGSGESRDFKNYQKMAEECFDYDYHYGHRRGYGYDFRDAADQAADELDNMLNDAEYEVNKRRYADAAGMAMSVAEVIPRNYENVDDSDGELGAIFNRAMELLSDIIQNDAVKMAIRRNIYDWCKQEANDSIYSSYGFDEIHTFYELCINQIGNADEVLDDLDKSIKEAKDNYNRSKAVIQKINFMQSRNLNAQDVIEAYLEMNEVRKIRFRQLTDERKFDEAIDLAKQGIAIAEQKGHPGTILDWKKAMYDAYLANGDTTNLLQMAEYMYLHSGYRFSKDEFYNAVKKHTPDDEWPATLERLLSSVEKERGFDAFTAGIMHDHQLWARLFAYCKKGNITEIINYESALKPHFEKDILACYRDHAEQRALITGEQAYHEVANTLKRMRTLAGGDDLVNSLLEKYRTTYKRRKNMMTALKNV